jgi:Na+/phosphate symporter
MKELIEFRKLFTTAFNINDDDFTSELRSREMVDARMIYSAIAYRYGGYSKTDIGKSVNRIHATIINLLNNYENISEYDENFKEHYKKGLSIFKSLEKNKGKKSSIVDILLETNSILRKKLTHSDNERIRYEEKVKHLESKLTNISKQLI